MSLPARVLLKAARILAVAAAIRWSVLAAYCLLVTWLMLTPAKLLALPLSWVPHVDKVLHFLVFGVLVWVFRWALTAHHRPNSGFVTVTLGAIGYGALMEWLQSLLEAYGRSFEWMDIVSNSAGAFCFWGLSVWLGRRVAAAERILTNQGLQSKTAASPAQEL